MIWRLSQTTAALVKRSKAVVPRCLTLEQRSSAYLAPEPPRWCITGAGLEAERDPTKWQPKWPYQSQAWRDWLAARDRGETQPLPAQ